MSSDDTRRLSIFEGNVVLTKGTIVIRADRIVVRQDAEGFQVSTATGAPARFRQKGDPRGDKEGAWTDGEALRMEMDDRTESIELFDKAYVKRDEDEVRGEYIFIDQRAEFLKVTPGKDGPVPGSDNRVRVVIQPKAKAEDAPKPPAGAPPAPAKPAASLIAPQAGPAKK